MVFSKAIDIWNFPRELLKYLPAGQWVKAGPDGDLGRFYGVKKSGTIVVAWKNNAKKNDYFSYCKNLHSYAKS